MNYYLPKSTKLVIIRNTAGNLLPGWRTECTYQEAIDNKLFYTVRGSIDVSASVADDNPDFPGMPCYGGPKRLHVSIIHESEYQYYGSGDNIY